MIENTKKELTSGNELEVFNEFLKQYLGTDKSELEDDIESEIIIKENKED